MDVPSYRKVHRGSEHGSDLPKTAPRVRGRTQDPGRWNLPRLIPTSVFIFQSHPLRLLFVLGLLHPSVWASGSDSSQPKQSCHQMAPLPAGSAGRNRQRKAAPSGSHECSPCLGRPWGQSGTERGSGCLTQGGGRVSPGQNGQTTLALGHDTSLLFFTKAMLGCVSPAYPLDCARASGHPRSPSQQRIVGGNSGWPGLAQRRQEPERGSGRN